MAVFFLIFALGSQSLSLQREHVDVIELNHVCKDNGEIQFSQIIIWRWMHVFPNSRHCVSEWFMVTGQDIVVDHWQGYERVTWRGENGMCCMATCRTFKETATAFDPEMLDRQILRPELRKPYFIRSNGSSNDR